MLYRPASVVTVEVSIPVSTFTALTATPGMTDPVASVTVPRIVPRSLWAAITTVARIKTAVIEIVPFTMLAMMILLDLNSELS